MAHTLPQTTLYTALHSTHSLLWSSFECAMRFSLHLFLFLLEGVALQDDLLIPSLVAYLLVADRGQHLPIVGVFVTLPREQGGCSFAVGRSSLSLSPPPARGHIPGFAPTTGGCGALRRGARRMVLQAASTMGGEHVRWASARHSNWPPRPLPLQRCRSHPNRPSALPGWGRSCCCCSPSRHSCHCSCRLTWIRRARLPRPSASNSAPVAQYDRCTRPMTPILIPSPQRGTC